jgi:hypothetical protein
LILIYQYLLHTADAALDRLITTTSNFNSSMTRRVMFQPVLE